MKDELTSDKERFTFTEKRTWFKHTTSKLHYPQSNGFTERHVNRIKIANATSISMSKALTRLRETPIGLKPGSSTEILHNRPIGFHFLSQKDPAPLDSKSTP